MIGISILMNFTDQMQQWQETSVSALMMFDNRRGNLYHGDVLNPSPLRPSKFIAFLHQLFQRAAHKNGRHLFAIIDRHVRIV